MTTVLCALYLTLGWLARIAWDRVWACVELVARVDEGRGGGR